MSVVFTRVGTPLPGRLGDAANFMKQRAEALKSNYGLEIGLNARFGGPAGQMSMVSFHDNLAELEDLRRKIITDVGAGNMPTPDAGIFANTHDAIWLKL